MDLLNLDKYSPIQIIGGDLALYVGMVIVIIFSFFICKKHGISKLSTLLFILAGYSGGIYFAKLMGGLYTVVSKHYGGGISKQAIFGVIVGLPIFLIAMSLLTGKKWRNITDLFAPGALLGLAFSKFGCALAGCCPGIVWEHGIYNNLIEQNVFPSQICESITMVFVVAFSFWYSLKYEKRKPGMAYPVTTMVYVITRFFWEFLRYYDIPKMKHLFLGLSFWQIWCIIVFAGSLLWLHLLKNDKLNEYEEKYYTWYNAKTEVIKAKLQEKFRKEKPADVTTE